MCGGAPDRCSISVWLLRDRLTFLWAGDFLAEMTPGFLWSQVEKSHLSPSVSGWEDPGQTQQEGGPGFLS